MSQTTGEKMTISKVTRFAEAGFFIPFFVRAVGVLTIRLPIRNATTPVTRYDGNVMGFGVRLSAEPNHSNPMFGITETNMTPSDTSTGESIITASVTKSLFRAVPSTPRSFAALAASLERPMP